MEDAPLNDKLQRILKRLVERALDGDAAALDWLARHGLLRIAIDEKDHDTYHVDCNELIYELFGEEPPEDAQQIGDGF